MKHDFVFSYQSFSALSDLEPALQSLATAANDAIALAHAPYSQFKVGAALLLEDGQILYGANQENAAFPAGLCAERVVLATASAQTPNKMIKAIAISYHNEAGKNHDPAKILSPCGICRQSLREVSDRQAQPIQVLMVAPSGQSLLVATVDHLLPFGFNADFL